MRVRTLLMLARIPNLPTVWSNVTAVALTQSQFSLVTYGYSIVGGSALYIGGMILNDVCDVSFDREFRPERPIPSGRAGFRETLTLGLCLFASGLVVLFLVSPLALVLGALVLVYDRWHKNNPVSPLLMGLCRAALICTVASGFANLTGSLLHALSMTIYIIGISIIAKNESKPETQRSGIASLFLLAAFLPALANSADLTNVFRWLVFSLALLPLLLNKVRPAGIGALVSGLLASIPWVDCWNLSHITPDALLVFVGFYAGAIFLRRFAPAT